MAELPPDGEIANECPIINHNSHDECDEYPTKDIPVEQDELENMEKEDDFERQAVLLRRDDDRDSGEKATEANGPKQKSKVKKRRQLPVEIDFQFGDKPRGASSSSVFAGDDDENIYTMAELQQEMFSNSGCASSPPSAEPEDQFYGQELVRDRGDAGDPRAGIIPASQAMQYSITTPTSIGFLVRPPYQYGIQPTPVLAPPYMQAPGPNIPWSTNDGTSIHGFMPPPPIFHPAPFVPMMQLPPQQQQPTQMPAGGLMGSTGPPTSAYFTGTPAYTSASSTSSSSPAPRKKVLALTDPATGAEISWTPTATPSPTPPATPPPMESSQVEEKPKEKNHGTLVAETTPVAPTATALEEGSVPDDWEAEIASEEPSRANSVQDEIQDDVQPAVDEIRDERMMDADFCDRQVQRIKEELLNLKKTSESAKKAYDAQIQELTAERDELDRQLKKLQSSFNHEKLKFNNDKKKHIQDMQKFEDNIKKLKSELEAKTRAYNALSAEMEDLQTRNAELEAQACEVQNGPCNCNIDVDEFRQRAAVAEVALLRLKRQVEIRSLDRAQKDAEFIIHHLNSIIEKANKEEAVALVQYQKQWEQNLAELKHTINIIGMSFDEQVRQVEAGVRLANLRPVTVPQPPAPPQPPMKPTTNPELIRSPISQRSLAASPASIVSSRSQNGMVPRSNVGQYPIRLSSPAPAAAMIKPAIAPRMSAAPSQAPVSNFDVPSTVPKEIQPPPGFHPKSNINPHVIGSGFGTAEIRKAKIPPPNSFRPISTPPVPSPPPSSLNYSTGGRPPVAAPSVAVPVGGASATVAQAQQDTASGEKKLQKLEMLINAVIEEHPYLTRESVLKGVEEFRKRTPNETLKGIPYKELVRGVCQIVYGIFPRPTAAPPAVAPVPMPPQPRLPMQQRPMMQHQPIRLPPQIPSFPNPLASAGHCVGAQYPIQHRHPMQPQRQQMAHSDDDECFVCLEKLSVKTVLVMDCGHRGHDACLRAWFQQQKSCPICRTLALPPDEYPNLH